ncbi:MAG: hypothetical protein EXR79_17345 [Myxococcales bacterium]|nr:hypothetical protein [Myxococcales bacterium]
MSFAEDLDNQCRRVLVPGAVVCLTAWLPYLWLDRKLHPDLYALQVLRVGLTVVALVVLVLARLPGQPVRPVALSAALMAYLQVATAAITGLSGGDSVYVGGFMFIIMVAPAVPLPLAVTWSSLGASLAVFLATGFVHSMAFATVHGRYSLNDLVMAGAVSALLSYVMNTIRRQGWVQARQLLRQEAAHLRDADRIAALQTALLQPALARFEGAPLANDALDHRPELTVVAVDPEGLTELATLVHAHGVRAELDAWQRFVDSVLAGHGLVACRALDDTPVHVAGLDGRPDHAAQAQRAVAALEAANLALSAERVTRGLPPWRPRVGLASGPALVARPPAALPVVWDLWHDTVASAVLASATGGPVPVAAVDVREEN